MRFLPSFVFLFLSLCMTIVHNQGSQPAIMNKSGALNITKPLFSPLPDLSKLQDWEYVPFTLILYV